MHFTLFGFFKREGIANGFYFSGKCSLMMYLKYREFEIVSIEYIIVKSVDIGNSIMSNIFAERLLNAVGILTVEIK